LSRNDDNENREDVVKLEGGCHCGKVRYEGEGEPMMKRQCHCRECPYISGGSTNMFLIMPIAGFKYPKDTPKQFRRTDLECAVECCAECGTHLVSRPPGLPGVVVKVGTLEDPSLFDGPQIAICTMDKQPYHHVPEGMPSFERLPQR
jgi:hypothetical protein